MRSRGYAFSSGGGVSIVCIYPPLKRLNRLKYFHLSFMAAKDFLAKLSRSKHSLTMAVYVVLKSLCSPIIRIMGTKGTPPHM